MAIASFTAGGLFAPLQSLLGSFAPRRARRLREASAACNTRQPQRTAAVMPAVRSVVRPVARPLRVVRVFEGPQPRAAAGRMVISGRLADVCAELDRLAAAEAAAG